MSAKPISIEIIAKTAEYIRNVKGAEVSTEDLAEALVAVTDSSDDLERKLGRAMKDAARDTEVLEKAIKGIETQTRTTATEAAGDFDKIGRSADDAGGKVRTTMGETGREAASEFKSNLAETLASGGSPSELVLGTLAGVIPGLGPIMAAAATGLAAIAGLVFKNIQEQKEKTEELLKSFSSTMDSLFTQGVENATRVEKYQAFTDFVRENITLFQGLADEAELVGLNLEDIVSAAVLGGEPLDTMAGHLLRMKTNSKDAAGHLDEQGAAAETILGLMGQLDEKSASVRGEQDLTARAAKAIADSLGVADTNADGVIDDSDQIADNMSEAEKAAKGMDPGVPKTKADTGQIWDDWKFIAETPISDPGLPNTRRDAEATLRAINGIPKNVNVKVNVADNTSGSTGGRAFVGKFRIE